jgi:hypothetical protein
MAELDLLSLTCVKKEDSNARDEVTLLVDGDVVFGPIQMANGDVIPIPVGNLPIPPNGQVGVEVFEQDNAGADQLQLGAVTIPDTLPAFHTLPGVFDDELPGAFYYMTYQVVP